MAINKRKKEELVEQYKQLVKENSGLILTSYSGVSVKELEGLRAKIRELDGSFVVVKNSLLRLALNDANISLPEDSYIGTTAVGFASEDIPALAKSIVDMAREHDDMKVKAGVVSGEAYSAAEVERLAALPPLPVVRGQLLGVLQAPAGRIAGVVASSVRQVKNVLNAYAESESETAAA